jgi:hypothetical protein
MCGGVVEDVVSSVDDALVGLDKTVGEAVPGGWTTVGAAALAAATMGASLGATGALEAGAVVSADATAAGLGFSSAAEAISAGAVTAAELGLPAATTAAELATVSGTASAGWAGLGVEAGIAGGVPAGVGGAADVFAGYSATGSAAGGAASNLGTLASNVGTAASNVAGSAISTTEMIAQDALALKAQGLGAEQIAQTLTQSYGIDQFAASNVASMAAGGSNAAQIAGTLAADYGTQMAGVAGSTSSMPSVANLIKYASTGSQIVGGLGKMFGGAQALSNGRQVQPGQADPFSAYRPQYAAQLQNLMNDPNSVTKTPAYQFNLSQGLQGLQAQQAAQGRLVSGGALLQGQQFGQNLAQQSYQDQLKTLMSLSGASQSPGVGATAMSNIGASNLGSTLGGWQSIAGGFGQVANPLATLYANFNNPSPNPSV